MFQQTLPPLISHLEKANNQIYDYRFSFKESILMYIFLSNNSGKYRLENDGPNKIRKGKPIILRCSDPKRPLKKIPKSLGQAG